MFLYITFNEDFQIQFSFCWCRICDRQNCSLLSFLDLFCLTSKYLPLAMVCVSRHTDTVLVYQHTSTSVHTPYILMDLFNSFLWSEDFNMCISLHVLILLNLSCINSTNVNAVLVLIVPSMHINLKFYLTIYLKNLITISILLLCKGSLILLLL